MTDERLWELARINQTIAGLVPVECSELIAEVRRLRKVEKDNTREAIGLIGEVAKLRTQLADAERLLDGVVRGDDSATCQAVDYLNAREDEREATTPRRDSA